MKQPTLSVIIPCYNEAKTIAKVIKGVKKNNYNKFLNMRITKQIIVVDDGSTDDSWKIISKFKGITKIHKENGGKGSAVKAAIPHCKGKYTIIQDADWEYRSDDYLLILCPASYGYKAIFGSRRINPHNECNRSSHLSFYLGGNALTAFANLLFGLRLTDAWTGYKCIDTKLLKSMKIESDGFELCSEMVAKLAKKKVHIFEVPIFYYPRKISAGKKIKWKDGVRLAWRLVVEKWLK